MARISTHVLDLAGGKPAAGVKLELYRCGAARELLQLTETNLDGRTDQPLLTAEELPPGPYELIFHAGGYSLFFDVITIRFNVSDARANYHVPLLLAPHGYSTYRGS